MSEPTYNLKPLQEAVLRVFKEFARICERHDLKYYAAYGTALGAIRHKGFIPWDDDLDVAMPRVDYNMFVRIVKKELPSNIEFLRGGETFYAPVYFGRLIDVRPKIKQELVDSTHLPIKDPPFIDIFILEGIPDNILMFSQVKKITKFWRFCQLYRYPDSGFHVSFFKRVFAKVCGIFFDWKYRKTSSNEDMMQVLDELMCQWANSSNLIEPAFFRMKESRILPRSFFEPARIIPFEDTVIRVASNVEEILIRYYGDYLQLPPMEQRLPPHVLRLMYDGHV